MEQEVQITVTLSVDANLSKKGIESRFKDMLKFGDTHDNGITVMGDFKVKEEHEIYSD